VKCDQTRPGCKQCAQTRRTCDGYPTLAEKSAAVVLLATAPSVSTVTTVKEHRSLQFFEHKTAVQFAGLYDHDFWASLVLQTSSREPCIRHAVLALGSLHEAFQTEFLPPGEGRGLVLPRDHHEKYAAYHYVKAIELLNTHIVSRGWSAVDVSLLCCILCVSYEWLRGSYADAQVHLINGLRVLGQWGRDRAVGTTSSRSREMSFGSETFIRNTLMPVYTRYALQAKTSEAALPWDSSMLPGPQTQPVDSLKAARDSFNAVLAQIYLMPHLPDVRKPDDAELGTHVSTLISQWFDRYTDFVSTASSDTQSLPQIRLLDAAYAVNRIMLLKNPTDDQMRYDDFTSDFAAVVDNAEVFINSSPPAFSVDIAIIPVLYLVSLRCRDPRIRRRAIALNQRVARREGVWDSQVAARVASEIVAIEEEGMTVVEEERDIGVERRVRRVWYEADLGRRRVIFRFSRCGELEWSGERVLGW
jgi:hypothetical protein